MAKFKPGDIIELEDGREGKISTVVADMIPILYAVDPFDSEGTILMYEHQLRKPGWNPKSARCQCGAQHDREFPQVHSLWCPEWTQWAK